MSVNLNGTESFIMHGEGVRKWSNASGQVTDVYEGEYRDGQAMGNGKFTYANGDVYEG